MSRMGSRPNRSRNRVFTSSMMRNCGFRIVRLHEISRSQSRAGWIGIEPSLIRWALVIMALGGLPEHFGEAHHRHGADEMISASTARPD